MSDRAPASTPHLDAGVRHRMRSEERRISSQHTQLNDLYQGVASSLERSGVHTARVAFTRFADALEAHLALEDDLYFPALHGLRPDLGGQLTLLVREHRALRLLTTELHALFEAGERDTASDRLADLAEHIRSHEAKEEALISQINTRPLDPDAEAVPPPDGAGDQG